MQGKKEICVLILGDFSPCLEHILRAYYILKTGRDSKFFVEECENIGIETTIRKKEKIRVHLQVKKVIFYPEGSRSGHIEFLFFYQNLSCFPFRLKYV